MPSYASIFISGLWGFLTAVILWISMPLLLLGELGGPIDFAVPILFIVAVALALAACTARPRGSINGIISAWAFSGPVAFVCYRMAYLDPAVMREHGAQFKFCGLTVVVLAMLAMTSVALLMNAIPKKPDPRPGNSENS